MINKFSSAYFNVTWGIRQGYVISALLYIIQSDLLAQRSWLMVILYNVETTRSMN